MLYSELISLFRQIKYIRLEQVTSITLIRLGNIVHIEQLKERIH